MMMTLTELSDQYFQWWQSAASRYVEMFKREPFFLQGMGLFAERSLEFKKLVDQVVDEMWRNFRLPSLEEITRLHERLNLLESHLVTLQERDWAQEVTTVLEKRNLVARDDLKPLKKALADVEKQVADASKKITAEVEAKVISLTKELAQIKEAVAQMDPKLGSLAATCERLAAQASAKKPGGAA